MVKKNASLLILMDEHLVHMALDERLNKDLKLIYNLKKGSNLNSVVSRVLTNKNLNLWMMSYLPNESGIYLGESEYFDDIRVKVPYGLTVDFKNTPRKTGLFIGECYLITDFNDIELKEVMPVFPEYYNEKYYFRGWPSADEFLIKVNRVFSEKDLKNYLVHFKK